ncbi:DUF6233 domain-containing protein [Streptomyces subrutilus]|uniref:DUF6233 domain-containing protein n=1 Tax=Streptomyces subrutilus TaxID=36818 RepID=UPI0033E84BBE
MAGRAGNRCRPAAGPRACRGCWDATKRCAPATAEQIRALLAQGIAACPQCRPDTILGVLE